MRREKTICLNHVREICIQNLGHRGFQELCSEWISATAEPRENSPRNLPDIGRASGSIGCWGIRSGGLSFYLFMAVLAPTSPKHEAPREALTVLFTPIIPRSVRTARATTSANLAQVVLFEKPRLPTAVMPLIPWQCRREINIIFVADFEINVTTTALLPKSNHRIMRRCASMAIEFHGNVPVRRQRNGIRKMAFVHLYT